MDEAGRAKLLEDRRGLFRGGSRIVGDADIKRLARTHGEIQRTHGFLEGGVHY